MPASTYSAAYLADFVQGELLGGDLSISGIATLKSATANEISFLSNSRYQSELETSQAGFVLLKPEMASLAPRGAIVVDDPYLAYAKISQLFVSASVEEGISKDAMIAPTATVSGSARVAAGAVIEADARVGEHAVIAANAVVGRGASIGDGTQIAANVTIGYDVRIGQRCTVHSGAVIGADGFGFAPSREGWQKIAQLGSVVIGDDVEIGACTTIDRGALEDTRIENGVKLDNQIQIAHNVVIGEHTAIAGGCAIAGSTRIGKRCTIAGMSGITGHIEIADGTHVTAMSLVSRSIKEPGAYSSGTAIEPHRQWKRNAVRFRQLDEMHKRILELEELVKKLAEKG